MPLFKATEKTLASYVVESLVEAGNLETTLAQLAQHFRDVIAETLPDEDTFAVSIRIYHTLKQLEAQFGNINNIRTASELHITDQNKLITVYATLEYFLYDLNRTYTVNSSLQPLDLRYNPFLTHWIEATAACEDALEDRSQQLQSGVQNANIVAKKRAYTARLIVLRTILKTANDEQEWKNLGSKTAKEVTGEYAFPVERTDLTPYMEMLYETEVWDRPTGSAVEGSAQLGTKRNGKASAASEGVLLTSSTPSNPASITVKDIETALRSDPTSTYQYLTHLPIELANLELVNGVLASGTLPDLEIEPLDLARNFIQHGLRDIEAMCLSESEFNELNGSTSAYLNALNNTGYSSSPPLEFLLSANNPPNSQPGPSGAKSNSSTLFQERDTSLQHDREAQTRAIKLLVLFMKNLIKKGLVADATDPAGLLYEIEEICVRYIFVPEVRQFRRWIEGEDELEGVREQGYGQTRMGG